MRRGYLANRRPALAGATVEAMRETRAHRRRVITGTAQLESALFSNQWELHDSNGVIATLRRFGKMHVSTARLADGTEWLIEPAGWGTVRVMDGDDEVARITRLSTWGRRWDIQGFGFAYQLVSNPRPRSWRLEIGSSPLAELDGGFFSYNSLSIETGLSVPVAAILLAWHVVARPWEAAAAPKGLVRQAPVKPA